MARFPSTLEKVSPLDCRETSLGAGGGAFLLSRCATHLRSRYTPAVRMASTNAAAADNHAYFAASLLFMHSVKQNFGGLYRRGRRLGETKQTSPRTPRQPPCPQEFRCWRQPRNRAAYSSPDTWLHRRGAANLPWCANPRGRRPRPRWA